LMSWSRRRAPFEILQRAMVGAGRQLLRFQAGDGLSEDFARMVAGHLAPVFGPGIEKVGRPDGSREA
jgi:hypothetical protein